MPSPRELRSPRQVHHTTTQSEEKTKDTTNMATKAQVAKSRRTPKYSTRLVRRCELTGRSRSVYRKFRISRIMLRKLALEGKIPGMRKASW